MYRTICCIVQELSMPLTTLMKSYLSLISTAEILKHYEGISKHYNLIVYVFSYFNLPEILAQIFFRTHITETQNSVPKIHTPCMNLNRKFTAPYESLRCIGMWCIFFNVRWLKNKRLPTLSFSLPHRVQTGYGAHPASYPMGTGDSFSGLKRSEREADQSPTYSVEVKNAWLYISSPQHVFMTLCFVKLQEQLYLP
jgi:hypothetical protein